MTSIREKFVTRFGEEQAQKLEAAAKGHENGVHDKKGSDPFKWVVLICIGYQCVEVESYRSYHGITIPFKQFKLWVKREAELGSHDGDCDYISLIAGVYNEFVKKPKKVSPAR